MKADKELINRLLKTAAGQIEGISRWLMRTGIAWIFQIKYWQLSQYSKANNEILKAHLHMCVKEALMKEMKMKKLMKLFQ